MISATFLLHDKDVLEEYRGWLGLDKDLAIHYAELSLHDNQKGQIEWQVYCLHDVRKKDGTLAQRPRRTYLDMKKSDVGIFTLGLINIPAAEGRISRVKRRRVR